MIGSFLGMLTFLKKLTIRCTNGCGQQIEHELHQFSDGFIYRLPLDPDGKIHLCPIWNDMRYKENFYQPALDSNPDRENSYGNQFNIMSGHQLSFFHEYSRSLTDDVLLKWKNVLQSDANSFIIPHLEFYPPLDDAMSSWEFSGVLILVILGKIYARLELYDDAIRCQQIQLNVNKLWLTRNENGMGYEGVVIKTNKQHLDELEELIKEHTMKSTERKIQRLKIEKPGSSKLIDSELDIHTQIHLAKVETNLRKFILELWGSLILLHKQDWFKIGFQPMIDEQIEKDKKLLYDGKEESELDKLTIGSLEKILENGSTRSRADAKGIDHMDDLIRHIQLIAEYRNPLDHTKCLVDGDLPEPYKSFEISCCMIVNKFFMKNLPSRTTNFLGK